MKRPFFIFAIILSAGILLLYAFSVIDPLSESPYLSGPIINYSLRSRDFLERVIDQAIPQYQAGLIKGVVLGDKSGIDFDTYAAFRQSGLAHLLAVSGLHVGFIASALQWLLKKLKIKPAITFLCVALFLTAYCFITAFPASIVRATVMILISFLANVLGRKNDMLNSLGLAAIIILLADPVQLFKPGFLLSFGAVYGIAALSKSFSIVFKKLPNPFRDSLSISLAATLGTMVIAAVFFNQLTVLSLVTNIIAIPLASVAVVVGFAGTLAGLAFTPAGAALLFVSGNIMQTVSFIAEKAASLPFGSYDTISVHPAFIPLWWAFMYLCSPYFTRYLRRRMDKQAIQ